MLLARADDLTFLFPILLNRTVDLLLFDPFPGLTTGSLLGVVGVTDHFTDMVRRVAKMFAIDILPRI